MSEADLGAALGRAQDALLALPGVVGTAIGKRTAGSGLAVHVYVDRPGDVEPVSEQAQLLLAGAPFEVRVTGRPSAEGG